MNSKQKKLIMLVGKTHTGKTTFAKSLCIDIPSLLQLEADPIASFMKREYPTLRELDDREHTGAFKDISLKYQVFLLFVEFAMSFGKDIVLSNSNMWQKGRESIRLLAQKYNYELIGVYFDFDESVLSERIKDSSRTTDVLEISKDFDALLMNQRSRMQPPEKSEFDALLVVTRPSELDKLKEDIIDLLNH